MNWAGNYEYSANRLYRPASVEQVQEILRGPGLFKALGARHSFNGIPDTTGTQISLQHLNQIVFDEHARTVTVGAGVTYGQLAPYLHGHGWAVHNMASLPHISIAGACATGTHGSGNKNANLSTAVAGMEIVTADGDVVRSWDRQSAIVNLGALGIVTALTLHIEPAYDLRQVIYENLSFSVLSSNLDDIFGAGYSVSLFTDWRNHQAAQVWLKAHAGQGLTREFFGAKAATRKLHPIAGYSAESCTDQFGVPGPWYERLPHFRMDFTPSSGEELQSEYFVPRERGYEAILAVEKLRDQIAPHLMISELRTIDADDLWMSPCYQRESLAIHFTWKPDWPAVKNVLPLIEEQLAPFDARPHWAKLFTMPPARLQSLYEKLPAFRALLKQHDPAGKFRNDYLNGKLLVDS